MWPGDPGRRASDNYICHSYVLCSWRGGVGELSPGAIICMIHPSPPGQLLRRPFFPPFRLYDHVPAPSLGHGFPGSRGVGLGVSIFPVNPPRLRPRDGSVPGWLWLPSPLTTNVGRCHFH